MTLVTGIDNVVVDTTSQRLHVTLTTELGTQTTITLTRQALEQLQDAVMSGAFGNTAADALDRHDLMQTFTSLPWR